MSGRLFSSETWAIIGLNDYPDTRRTPSHTFGSIHRVREGVATQLRSAKVSISYARRSKVTKEHSLALRSRTMKRRKKICLVLNRARDAQTSLIGSTDS
mgnify:CR=1 FL=1